MIPPHPDTPPTLSDADCRSRLGLSWEEAARLVAHHTLDVQAWLPGRAGQVRRFEGRGTRAVSNGMPVRLFNQALGADYATEAEADEEIQAVKAFFAARDVPWMWWLDPFVRPAALSDRLSQQGLMSRGPLPAMLAALTPRNAPPAPGVCCWQAENHADLAQASMIRRIAFSFPAHAGMNYFEEQPDSWLDAGRARLYLARRGERGPAAAIGALILGEGLPGVYVMATLPAQERQGLGRAILLRILADAAAMGHAYIVLTASRKGYGLYTRFGFENIFNFGIYEAQ